MPETKKLAPLVREIGWSNNVLIMMRERSDEAREFYLLQAKKNSYSARELEHQTKAYRMTKKRIMYENKKETIRDT